MRGGVRSTPSWLARMGVWTPFIWGPACKGFIASCNFVSSYFYSWLWRDAHTLGVQIIC